MKKHNISTKYSEAELARIISEPQRNYFDDLGIQGLLRCVEGASIKKIHAKLMVMRNLFLARRLNKYAYIDSDGHIAIAKDNNGLSKYRRRLQSRVSETFDGSENETLQ